MGLSTTINGFGGGAAKFTYRDFNIEVLPVTGSVWSGKCDLTPPYTFEDQWGDMLFIPDQLDDKVILRRDIPMTMTNGQMVSFKVVGSDGCVQPWNFNVYCGIAMPNVTQSISNASPVGRNIFRITYVPEGKVPFWGGDSKVDVVFDEEDDFYWLEVVEDISSFSGSINGQLHCEGVPTGDVIINIVDYDGKAEPPHILVQPGPELATLYFTDYPQNISEITQHIVYIDGEVLVVHSGGSPYVINGLSADVPVVVEVTSINASGESIKSEAVTVTPYSS